MLWCSGRAYFTLLCYDLILFFFLIDTELNYVSHVLMSTAMFIVLAEVSERMLADIVIMYYVVFL